MKMKIKEKKKDLVLVLKDNKSLAEILSKAEEENAKYERKIRPSATKKVMSVSLFWKL